MSTRCLAERTGFKKMDDVSEAEGKIRWAMRTDNMLIISRKDEDDVIGIIILTPKEINLPQGTLVDYEICYFIETSFQGEWLHDGGIGQYKGISFQCKEGGQAHNLS